MDANAPPETQTHQPNDLLVDWFSLSWERKSGSTDIFQSEKRMIVAKPMSSEIKLRKKQARYQQSDARLLAHKHKVSAVNENARMVNSKCMMDSI